MDGRKGAVCLLSDLSSRALRPEFTPARLLLLLTAAAAAAAAAPCRVRLNGNAIIDRQNGSKG